MPTARTSLRARIAARLPELTDAVLDRCAAEIPFYRQLPADQLAGDVRDSIARTLDLVLRTQREDRGPDAAELAEIIDVSGRRAADGVPLEAVLAAYHVAAETCWRLLAAEAGPEEMDDFCAIGTHMLRYLRDVVPAVAGAHLHERQQAHSQEREARRALVAALLAGEPAAPLADDAGVVLAPAYAVLVVRLAPDTDDTAARRTARRLQSALGAHRPDALSALTGEGGVILFPAASGALDTVTADLPGLVARIGASLARPVTGAVARAADVAAVPAAHREAAEIADLAQRLGLPPGCHALEDVLLEYQLARPGRGLAGLAAKLRPLDDHPVLLETVRTLVRHGNNRTRAAAHLHVHRNTLDYRLGRVAALTGLDAGDPRDLRVLHAAVTARALAGA